MIKDFLLEYAKLISLYPEKISIEQKDLEDNFVEIIIYADKIDAGKLIGKDGKVINALKTVIMGCKSKDPLYKITVKSI